MAPRIRKIIAAAVILAVVAWLPAVLAQTYPSRPIKLVVTFPAGGGADFVGRVMAGKLSEALGQLVVVDNRAGAGGMIGNEVIAKSAPDGYSLLLGAAGALTIAPNLYEKVTFDSIKDFEPVALIASSPFVLTVNLSVPANTLNELTAIAKANPGKLNLPRPARAEPRTSRASFTRPWPASISSTFPTRDWRLPSPTSSADRYKCCSPMSVSCYRTSRQAS